ncbi:xanthine dehydrogenase family protein molybdopterin-binding subunit [Luteolibacter flavescens]|uniref:Xanthine dehydrogenase family protein molybdopterin-binding subunit n=1 Tax=Luteolibacter flavescens TaxID=1859460 RepID=A0ABT3FV19_9BACT|nr:aldehyde oxidoreductase molybdenum-binding subunit PaoC [Luteolibacter flavescens]MCW1887439.1 xanthine dehydrogenase family protein molybdopterin-binding subunit [Luteolibacter flavescens]
MKFDAPAGINPIDRLKVVGKATDRIEGPLKVTGKAPYAYERHDVAKNQAYGYLLGSAIAKGKILRIDIDAAKAAPGVITIVTSENAGQLAKAKMIQNVAKLLAGPEVEHYHQSVALVVAETYEQARSASRLIKVDYEKAEGRFDLAEQIKQDAGKEPAPPPGGGPPPVYRTGDFDAAFAEAPVTLDATYSTPDHSHAMMEPHATIAAWDGDELTVWTSTQMVAWAVRDLSETLRIPPAKLRVISPYIGGGFGAKLRIRSDILFAALGARLARRPVKLALERAHIMNNTGHRAATVQRIRLGSTRDGKLTSIAHEGWSGNLPGGRPENSVAQTRLLYAAPHRFIALRKLDLDLPEGDSMRAPGEAPGLMALEIAMDEMAEKLGMDPVEFRVINDTMEDPEKPGRPFSHRALVECLRQGAKSFGWDKRQAKPGTVREGRWRIGLGVAAAFRNNLLRPSAARVRLDGKGIVTVETDMTDIGTGTYTIVAQTAAETMGVALDKVVVKLGDSSFPASAGSGGQWGAANSTAGVYAACMKLRGMLATKLGFDPAVADFSDGRIISGEHRILIGDVAGNAGLVAEDSIEYNDAISNDQQQSTFGSHFVEAAVDIATGETRVRRMLAVCSAGRILNPKAARSQMIGAMVMGVGGALMEACAVDKKQGFFVNHDLASYEVPVHADIPHQEVIFLDETDPRSTPMKAKGVGELGICGVSAAVANAIYNATGVRVRDYPITLEKLIAEMPDEDV